MSKITEFLLARIAEDEAGATAIEARQWGYGSYGGGDTVRHVYVAGTRVHIDASGNEQWFGPEIAHIARHDPARVLAECAAKRAIVKLAEDVESMDTQISNEWGGPNDGTADDILRALAAVYAGHEDYRQEWAA